MKLPLIPTAFVAFACATMIGLGIWQLQRAQWKEGLLNGYLVAKSLPETAYPAIPLRDKADVYYYRRARGTCLTVVGWRAVGGRSDKGVPGWVHIADCRTGAEGPGMPVEAGWSKTPVNPDWKGGEVAGIIAPDTRTIFRLVSANALAPGLEASAPPSIEDIPNNHMAYAVQWFLFAAVAAVIYSLALIRRDKN